MKLDFRKLLCAIFLCRSPRNAAVFGFSLVLIGPLVLPGLFFLHRSFGAEPGRLVAAGSLLLLPFSLYGLIVLGCAYAEMTKRCFPEKVWFRWFGIAMALIYRAGGFIVVPCLLKQRRAVAAAAGSVAVLFLILSFFMQFGFPFAAPGWGLGIQAAGIILFLAALISFRDGNRFRFAALLPLLLPVLYSGWQLVLNGRLDREIAAEEESIGRLIGRPADPEHFLLREAEGVSLSDEKDLSRLIAAPLPERKAFELPPYASPEQYAAKAAELRREYPEFVAAVEAFSALAPRPVRHEMAGEPFAVYAARPEIAAFQRTAHYLAVEMVASSGDRAELLRRSAQLERVRDWFLLDSSLLAKLLGVWAETIRLDAVGRSFAAGTLTENDVAALLASRPDWNGALLSGLADELAFFQLTLESVRKGIWVEQDSPDLFFLAHRVRPAFPVEFDIWLKQDYLFALQQFRQHMRIVAVPESVADVAEKDIWREVEENRYLFSGMLLPSYENAFRKFHGVELRKTLIRIAFLVELHRREHGMPPESLDVPGLKFLPANIDRAVIRYEHGMLEFKAEGGAADTAAVKCRGYRISAENTAEFPVTVILK